MGNTLKVSPKESAAWMRHTSVYVLARCNNIFKYSQQCQRILQLGVPQ